MDGQLNVFKVGEWQDMSDFITHMHADILIHYYFRNPTNNCVLHFKIESSTNSLDPPLQKHTVVTSTHLEKLDTHL